jgi:hypothetical protein
MISNVRGDYAAGQIAQAQTPRPTTKMPPMGQFDPPSTSKENKKRRGGLGVQPSTQAGLSSSLDAMGIGQAGRGSAVQMGNVNKVSQRLFCWHLLGFRSASQHRNSQPWQFLDHSFPLTIDLAPTESLSAVSCSNPF